MIRSLSTTSIAYSSIGASLGGGTRMAVPVQKDQALYANFEHVYGLPNEQGVSVNRVKILDSLISHLVAVKRDRASGLELPMETEKGDAKRLDALIEQYGKELAQVAKAPQPAYKPAPALPSAQVFSLVA